MILLLMFSFGWCIGWKDNFLFNLAFSLFVINQRENKLRIVFLSLPHRGKTGSSVRKNTLVLNQGGVSLRPTNGLVIEKDAYLMWIYAIIICYSVYYCTNLCRICCRSWLFEQIPIGIILNLEHLDRKDIYLVNSTSCLQMRRVRLIWKTSNAVSLIFVSK